jgi:hypothetical protein
VIPAVAIEPAKEPVPVLALNEARIALIKLSDSTGVPLREIEKKMGAEVDAATADQLNEALSWVREVV